MKQFWDKEYKEIYKNIVFKFKKGNPIELITLVTESLDYSKFDLQKKQEFIQKCLQQVIWTKDGTTFFPLVDSEGNSRLPELLENPSIAFDLFFTYRKDVINEVFIESKTYQHLTQAKEK